MGKAIGTLHSVSLLLLSFSFFNGREGGDGNVKSFGRDLTPRTPTAQFGTSQEATRGAGLPGAPLSARSPLWSFKDSQQSAQS